MGLVVGWGGGGGRWGVWVGGGGGGLGVVRVNRLIFEFAKDGFWIIMGNVM